MKTVIEKIKGVQVTTRLSTNCSFSSIVSQRDLNALLYSLDSVNSQLDGGGAFGWNFWVIAAPVAPLRLASYL